MPSRCIFFLSALRAWSTLLSRTRTCTFAPSLWPVGLGSNSAQGGRSSRAAVTENPPGVHAFARFPGPARPPPSPLNGGRRRAVPGPRPARQDGRQRLGEQAAQPAVYPGVDHQMDAVARAAVADRMRVGEAQVPGGTDRHDARLAVEP